MATFPVVPIGKERLRITVTAAHELVDVDRLAACILELFDETRPEPQ